MAKYACLDNNGVIQNVIVSDEKPSLPEYAQILDWEEGMDINKKKIDGEWIDQTMILYVDLDKAQVPPNETVIATATVSNRDRSLTHDVNGTYYVPVIRQSDGKQEAFLTVEFTHGQATAQFSLSEPGSYTVDLTKVDPKPQSKLAASPKLIVKEN